MPDIDFSANISLLFTYRPLRERFAAAKKAGFRAVELLFPFEIPAEEMRELQQETGITLTQFNLRAGDWEAGERGFAARDSRSQDFRDSLEEAIIYARKASVSRLHAMAGVLPQNSDIDAAHASYIRNISLAARECEKAGLTLQIEPINHFDMTGYFLTSTWQALDIIAKIDHPALGLQLDLYHCARMQEDAQAAITAAMQAGVLKHIQIASIPDRHAPDPARFRVSLEHLHRSGYRGWIGAEYFPQQHNADDFGWLQPMRKMVEQPH